MDFSMKYELIINVNIGGGEALQSIGIPYVVMNDLPSSKVHVHR